MISPYLERPARTLEQALRERAESCAALHNHTFCPMVEPGVRRVLTTCPVDALSRLLLGEQAAPEPGRPDDPALPRAPRRAA